MGSRPARSGSFPQVFLCDFQSASWHPRQQYCVTLHLAHLLSGVDGAGGLLQVVQYECSKRTVDVEDLDDSEDAEDVEDGVSLGHIVFEYQ